MAPQGAGQGVREARRARAEQIVGAPEPQRGVFDHEHQREGGKQLEQLWRAVHAPQEQYLDQCADHANRHGSDQQRRPEPHAAAAFEGLQMDSPFGKFMFRAEDHQSTMGAFVGKTKNEGGKGVMVDYKYLDGAKYLPSNEAGKKLRAAE